MTSNTCGKVGGACLARATLPFLSSLECCTRAIVTLDSSFQLLLEPKATTFCHLDAAYGRRYKSQIQVPMQSLSPFCHPWNEFTITASLHSTFVLILVPYGSGRIQTKGLIAAYGQSELGICTKVSFLNGFGEQIQRLSLASFFIS